MTLDEHEMNLWRRALANDEDMRLLLAWHSVKKRVERGGSDQLLDADLKRAAKAMGILSGVRR